MKKLILKCICLMVLTALELNSQQETHYTQYVYNTLSVNPAYAGSRGVASLTGLYRSQWVGLEGAPETSSFNIHSPIKNNRVGLGFSVINDRLGEGVTDRTDFDLAFSYTIPFSEINKLAFGLKVGGQLLNVDFVKLRQFVQEVKLESNVDNRFSPNIGAGVYYHTNKWYLGFSVPNILRSKNFENDATQVNFIAENRVNYFLMAGYVFDIKNNWLFKPTLLARALAGVPLQMDLAANFLYKQMFLLGLSYRFDASLSGSFGFQLTKHLLMGFTYDREVTELGRTEFNNGSFEVFLRYELFNLAKNKGVNRFF